MATIDDFFGRACGYSNKEIDLAYKASAFLSFRLPALGFEYDPISYHRGDDGELVITGDVTLLDGRVETLTFDPLEYETPVYSCLVALKEKLKFDLHDNDEIVNIIDNYFES